VFSYAAETLGRILVRNPAQQTRTVAARFVELRGPTAADVAVDITRCIALGSAVDITKIMRILRGTEITIAV
jgi:hypothetical protein